MQESCQEIYSRVLVFDEDPEVCARLKEFLTDNNLVGVRQTLESFRSDSRFRLDLGAAVIAEDYGGTGEGLELALTLHELVRELPIFIRREGDDDGVWADRYHQAIAGCFSIHDPDGLKSLVSEYLFDTDYPMELVRIMEDVTERALASSFHDVGIEAACPYLVKDKTTTGTMVGLMPIETDWCRGYMLLQSSESNLRPLVAAGHTGLERHETDFRDLTGLLGEVCNMVWGGLKSRLLVGDGSDDNLGQRLQVPVTVTQTHEEMPFFLSFGTNRAQLCFRYVLNDPDGLHEPAFLHQSFIFNISWSPDRFRAREPIEDLVEEGELELL